MALNSEVVMSQEVHAHGGIGFAGLLAIVFITLKLTGVIAWSWWWVLAPLWIPPLIGIFIFLVCLFWEVRGDKRW